MLMVLIESRVLKSSWSLLLWGGRLWFWLTLVALLDGRRLAGEMQVL